MRTRRGNKTLAAILAVAMVVTMTPSSIYASEAVGMSASVSELGIPSGNADQVETEISEDSVSEPSAIVSSNETEAEPEQKTEINQMEMEEPDASGEGPSNAEDIEVAIDNEYTDYVSFYSDDGCLSANEIHDGDYVSSGTSVYVKYNGNVISDNDIGVKVTLNGNTNYLKKGAESTSNVGTILKDSENTIVVSMYQMTFVEFKNECPSEIKVYSDANRTQEITVSFNYAPGDTLFFNANELDDEYTYEVKNWDDNYNNFQVISDGPFANSFGEMTRLEITKASKPSNTTIKINNEYPDDIGIYRDFECTLPIKDGDKYDGYVYAKLLSENLTDAQYFEIKASTYNYMFLSNEKSIENIYIDSSFKKVTLTVEKKNKVSVSFGSAADVFDYYYDSTHTKQINEGDLITPDSRIYFSLNTEKAVSENAYSLYVKNIKVGNYSLDNPMGTYSSNSGTNASRIVISVRTISRARFGDIISYAGGVEEYVSFYRSLNDTKPIGENDYVTPEDYVYAKMTGQLQPSDEGIRISQDYKYNKSDAWNNSKYYLTYGQYKSHLLYNCNKISVEKYTKAKVNIEISNNYSGKIKFYYKPYYNSEYHELTDQKTVEASSEIYAKLTSSAQGESITVHLDNGTLMEVTGADYFNITEMGEDDITLTVRDGYHLVIEEEDLDEGMNISYSYSEDEGKTYQSISDNDIDGIWIENGSKLKITASGMTNERVPVVRIPKKGRFNSLQYKSIALYSENDEIISDLDEQAPIIVKGTDTTPVEIKGLKGLEQYVSCNYTNGTLLEDGDRVAIGTNVTVSVNGAPDQCAIYTYYEADGEDEWNCENYYHFYNEEEASEYEFGVCDGSTKITFDSKRLRHVTITRPEGFEEFTASWGDCESSNYGEYDFENTDSSYAFYVPDGEYISFYCYGGEYDYSQALKITANGQEEACEYMYFDESDESYGGARVSESAYEFTFAPVNMYRLTYDTSIMRIYGFYNTIYDADGEVDIYTIPYGETARLTSVNYDIPVSKRYFINGYQTGDSSKKVIDSVYVANTWLSVSFTMPAFPVTIDAAIVDNPSHKVNIKENNFSTGTAASYKKYLNSTTTQSLKDNDEVFEEQIVRVNADSIAENKKMLVTIKKTGTNEYATGSEKGTLIEGVQSAIFKMFDYPITIEVTEKDRKGSGKAVSIRESLSGRTNASYSVENGDLVEAGEDITLNVSRINTGASLYLNVICPNQNQVASGSDLSKPYFSETVTKTGEIRFKMPDYPIEIQIREDGNGTDAETDISNADIEMTTTSFVFNGTKIKPEYSVIYDGQVLEKDRDYTESYTSNITAGTAKLTVTGIGNYIGTLEKEFSITKRLMEDQSVSFTLVDRVIFNHKPKYEPKPVIKIGDYTLTEGTDYTLTYANNTAATDNATVTITGIGSMSGVVTKKFAIVKETQDLKDAIISLKVDSFEYTGEEISPEINVVCNSEKLVKDLDYSIAYFNNVNAGNAFVKITGLGNYTGYAKKDYSISKRKLNSTKFNAEVANQKYKKSTKFYEPAPIVTYDGALLILGVDYSLKYANNEGKFAEESKDAKVIITGKNNYEGSEVLPFSILKEYVNASKMKIIIENTKYTYDGTEHEPDVTVKYKGEELTIDSDFVVSYKDNVNAGTAKIIVSGCGEYAGSKTATFKIGKKELSSDWVSDIPSEVYNGMNCPTPDVTDPDTGAVLTLSDINYTYKNNKKVNTAATLKIKGVGNYKGTITKTFAITPLTFYDYEYSIDDCVYTGSKVSPDVIAVNLKTGERMTLKTGTALKVKFENNKEISNTAKATISPKNKKFFTIEAGSTPKKEITFSIVKCNLEDVTISPIKAQKYKKGKEIKPTLTVKVGTVKLKKNKAYKVSYSNNKEKGYAIATITAADGKHFEGTQSVQFVIK